MQRVEDPTLKRRNDKRCNDRQDAYIQRMHGCTAVSKGQTGEETDRQTENRQTGKFLCTDSELNIWLVIHQGFKFV